MNSRRDIRKELTTDEKWWPVDAALRGIKLREVKGRQNIARDDFEEYIVDRFSK